MRRENVGRWRNDGGSRRRNGFIKRRQCGEKWKSGRRRQCGDNPNTTQTLEYTKDKYNVKIIKRKVSPKVSPTTYVGRRLKKEDVKGMNR
jgi:hypothetical protein